VRWPGVLVQLQRFLEVHLGIATGEVDGCLHDAPKSPNRSV
jgi:hypothetical protein